METKNEESDQFQLDTKEANSFEISPGEVVIGALTGIDEQGQPLVNFTGNPVNDPVVAITTVGIEYKQVGRQVALLFTNGDLKKPVVIGLIHSPLHEMIANYQPEETLSGDTVAEEEKKLSLDNDGEAKPDIDNVFLDGKRIVLEGHDEIVLKCGDSSITLTKDGKILIRGKYLLNRSTGINRIMGGSVQVN